MRKAPSITKQVSNTSILRTNRAVVVPCCLKNVWKNPNARNLRATGNQTSRIQQSSQRIEPIGSFHPCVHCPRWQIDQESTRPTTKHPPASSCSCCTYRHFVCMETRRTVKVILHSLYEVTITLRLPFILVDFRILAFGSICLNPLGEEERFICCP